MPNTRKANFMRIWRRRSRRAMRRGSPEALTAVAAAAASEGDVDSAYAEVKSQIDTHIPDVALATRLMAISTIVSTAGDEFAIGVKKSGKIKKPA